MPPSLKLGTPILIDLNALLGRTPSDVIDLTQMQGVPADAILLEDLDPLTVLIAGTRRKMRR